MCGIFFFSLLSFCIFCAQKDDLCIYVFVYWRKGSKREKSALMLMQCSFSIRSFCSFNRASAVSVPYLVYFSFLLVVSCSFFGRCRSEFFFARSKCSFLRFRSIENSSAFHLLHTVSECLRGCELWIFKKIIIYKLKGARSFMKMTKMFWI